MTVSMGIDKHKNVQTLNVVGLAVAPSRAQFSDRTGLTVHLERGIGRGVRFNTTERQTTRQTDTDQQALRIKMKRCCILVSS